MLKKKPREESQQSHSRKSLILIMKNGEVQTADEYNAVDVFEAQPNNIEGASDCPLNDYFNDS